MPQALWHRHAVCGGLRGAELATALQTAALQAVWRRDLPQGAGTRRKSSKVATDDSCSCRNSDRATRKWFQIRKLRQSCTYTKTDKLKLRNRLGTI